MSLLQTLLIPGGTGGISGNPLAYNPMLALEGALGSFATNGSRYFNGTNQQFSMDSHADLEASDSFWVSCRIRVDSFLPAMSVFAKGTEWRLSQIDANTMRWQAEDSTAASLFAQDLNIESDAPLDDKWITFMSFVDLIDRAVTTWFEDQRYFAYLSGSNPPLVGVAPLELGARNNSLFYNGRLCSFIFGRTASVAVLADEIRTAVYNYGNPIDVRQLNPADLARWGCPDTVWALDGRVDQDEISTSGKHTLTSLPEGSGPTEEIGQPRTYAIGSQQV